MIGLVAGTGSLFRRLAGEIVPIGCGLIVGSFAAPFAGLVGGILSGLMSATFVSGLLVWVRYSRRRRRVYRVLLALHVLTWSAVGVVNSTPDAPSKEGTRIVSRAAWASSTTFRAGVASAAFALPERTTLGGWGTRQRRAALPAFGGFGVLGRLSLRMTGAPALGEAPRVPLFRHPTAAGDALGARAVVLIPDGEGPAFAVVRLDLVTLDEHLPRAVLHELEGALAGVTFAESTLLLCASHTHSGPGGVLRAPLAAVVGTDHFDQEVFDAVVSAATMAVAQAAREAQPARIAFSTSRDRDADGAAILARNRCLGDDAIDDRVLAMRLDAVDDGRILALVLHYAVQPVMLRPRHLAFGRDLPGALEAALSDALPGRPPVLFVNGAMGDVTPRRAPEGGAGGAAWLADRFAGRVASDLAAGEGSTTLRIAATSATPALGEPRAFVALGSRAAFHDRVLGSALGRDAPSVLANVISLPANAALWSLGLTEVRVGFTFDGAAGAMTTLSQGVGGNLPILGAVVFETREASRLRRRTWLWQGGIPTEGVGRRWRAAVEARRLPTPFVLGLTNGALGYVTTPEQYDGRCVYEARSTLYGRATARRLGEGLAVALEEALAEAEAEAEAD